MNWNLINKIPIFQFLKPKLKTFTYLLLLNQLVTVSLAFLYIPFTLSSQLRSSKSSRRRSAYDVFIMIDKFGVVVEDGKPFAPVIFLAFPVPLEERRWWIFHFYHSQIDHPSSRPLQPTPIPSKIQPVSLICHLNPS